MVSTTGLTADGVVDCLLGEETRAPSDLDLVLARLDVDHAGTLLESRGYEVST